MGTDTDSLLDAKLTSLHSRLDDLEGRLNNLDRIAALFAHFGWFKMLLSAFTAGLAGFWTPILAVASVVDPPIPTIAWLIGIGGGCMAMAQDVRSQLGLPPVGNNSAQLQQKYQPRA
jgi:hypothetical protein